MLGWLFFSILLTFNIVYFGLRIPFVRSKVRGLLGYESSS